MLSFLISNPVCGTSERVCTATFHTTPQVAEVPHLSQRSSACPLDLTVVYHYVWDHLLNFYYTSGSYITTLI